jgi:hypothetical protein
MTASTISAEEYKASLIPAGKKLVRWTMETFSTYVNLVYPHVTVKDGQEWSDANTKYTFLCEKHGEYEARADNVLNLKIGCQCQRCSAEACSSSAGSTRSYRSTKEERFKAELLYQEHGSYSVVARILGRSAQTVRMWLDPNQKQKALEKNKAWRNANRDKARNATNRYFTFEHGKANKRAGHSKRRALEWDALFPVLIDGVWHQVDMSQYLKNWDDRQMFVDWQSCQDYAQLQATCKELAEIHGEEFHVDHLVPLSAGGLHCTENFQIKQASINCSKNNKRIPADDALFCKRIFNILNT